MKSWSHNVSRTYWILIVSAIVAILLAIVFLETRPHARPRLGVTFSSVYARQLGLDPREVFTALLDDVGVRHFRIPVYWSETEPLEGEFHWDDVDWMMDEAAARGAQVTLVIGHKVPRWPECYIPDWAETGTYPFDREKLLVFMGAAVERYREEPALERWQVENEPYLPFGVCPEATKENIDGEVELVRSLDDRPIIMTASGELQRWGLTARQSDVLGISVYRITWNRAVGYIRYPLPPWFYRLRARLVRPATDAVIISELQAEPWFPEAIGNRSPSEWAKEFTADDLRANVLFAAQTGMPEVDLWGAEWWYFLLKNDEPELWEEAVRVFRKS
ncbi:hypothetical protein A2304_01785 [Candidatus Uhrbacteria bacterium RIFOXYB2_FULL_57_15]|uniref:Glycoside hydrolase family 42 N-terminal domain-containing protein n=1 Tax=Candidatus Uhrbacteria bacterium RIFOXYB2_FULL_57_15 TaxID=1802422 RepID=A0A1F7W866_9BACT|nr:MAG: hypothetical protein A2304_01785 [Candidatus Uhrbacteria bacterium RIFOXYB2_FULL_57_15]